jgi:hypothetical protein
MNNLLVCLSMGEKIIFNPSEYFHQKKLFLFPLFPIHENKSSSVRKQTTQLIIAAHNCHIAMPREPTTQGAKSKLGSKKLVKFTIDVLYSIKVFKMR